MVRFLCCRMEGGRAPRAVQNIMGLLHKAMEDAVEEGVIPVNPVPKLGRRGRRGDILRKNSDPLTI